MRIPMTTTIATVLFMAIGSAQSMSTHKPGALVAAKNGSPVSATDEILTNEGVVAMAEAGLSLEVMVTAIRQSSQVRFDMRAANLVELKRRKVPDAVLVAMQQRAGDGTTNEKGTGSPSPSHSATSAGFPKFDGAGIYVEGLQNGALTVVQLEPTVFSQGKSGGFLTSALTYGLKKAKWKAVANGAAAQLRLAESQPTFYFYFEQDGSGLRHSGTFTGWLAGASSPNEFVLAKMTTTDRARELVVGEFGVLGASSGTRSKDTIDLESTKIGPGLYKVRPTTTVEPGEYCFFFAAGGAIGMGGGTAGKLFDFGVDAKVAR